MATLRDKLAAQIAELQADRERIVKQAAADVAAVDAKLAVLLTADTVISKEVEQAYDALLKLGLVREI